eukprot:5418803-Pleurochrysis_carterae.AAC.3
MTNLLSHPYVPPARAAARALVHATASISAAGGGNATAHLRQTLIYVKHVHVACWSRPSRSPGKVSSKALSGLSQIEVIEPISRRQPPQSAVCS